ncbi:amino acid adenylation domain-containing protein [Streptomyces sp. NPDC001822]|uniref:amino acid adenylation domain-containing protein n=1 Tax=Streptomyces sp. NPDC001822 TaxID=3364614 RepID=UPI0036C60F26
MRTDFRPNASCVHEAFEEQARRSPDRTAVVVGETRFGYAEVDRLANGVARRLHDNGVRAGDRVGLCVQRDEWLVPALLGVMKAGATYVPLDPAYPDERIRFIAEDASLSAVLTSPGTEHVVPPAALSVPVENTPPADSLGLRADPTTPAYVIYTSGSTGTPKGVVVEHRSLDNLVRWFADHLSADELSGMLATSSVCFDPSTVEICAPLVAGGTVILAENVFAVPTLPARSEATVLVAAASALSALMREGLPPGVRTVITGGELVTRALCDRVYAHPQVRRVLNFYGPTECTVCCTMAEVDREGTGNPPIGRPIAGAELSVRTPEGAVAPDGETGELWVAGPGVSRGYLNRPELTAERFGPLGYRTGDLVRRLGDTYHFVGRADEQVKVAGVRLEPGEVEATLAAHPAVRHAVVLSAGDRLVGYAESDSATETELRAWLTARLPRHAVPWRVAVLSRIPVHPTGKVDRGALPAITAGHRPDTPYTAPRGDTEQLVADVIAEVLGLARVGAEDRFADLGGHSLAAARVVSELGRRRGTPVPLATFLDHPTAASLTRALDTLAYEPPLRRTPGLARYPLTSMQREFWLLRQLAPDVPVTTLTMRIGVTGPVGGPALREALDAVVRRHEVLRGTVRPGTEPYMVVGPPVAAPYDETDLRALPAEGRRRRLDVLHRDAARHIFDLGSESPLLRAAFARTADDAGELFVSVDHMAFDGASVAVFLRELVAELAGDPVDDPPVHVGDIALHERDLDGDATRSKRLETYWSTALEGAVIPDDLPGRHVAPGWETARVTVPLEQSLVTRLGAFAAETGTTPFAGWLAALGLVTGGLSGHEDVVIGAAAARRHRAGTERLLGPLVDTLPLRLRMTRDLTFGELVRQCAMTTVAALAHQELPARDLMDRLPAHRSAGASRTPVVITMLPQDEPATLSGGSFRLDLRSDRGSGASANEFSVFIARTADGSELQVEYATGRFARQDAAAFAERLLSTLRRGLLDPGLPLRACALLSRREIESVLALGEGPALPDTASATVLDAVLAAAADRPEAVAVTGPEKSLTYAELVDLSGRAASGLLDAGIRPGDVVGVSVPRDHLLPVALLAVWRAGAAYLPLDPGDPPARSARLAADGGAGTVLVRGPGAPGDPASGGPDSLDIDELLAHDADRDPRSSPLPGARPEGLAYVMYTSGSSGTPKGVEVTHANVIAFVEGFRAEPGIGCDDSMAAVAPLSFDVSVEEMWAPLTAGGRCVVVERACATDGHALAERITSSGVTVLHLTPTSMRMLLAADWPGHPDLLAVTGGETLDAGLAGDLLDRVGQVWNSYGPTETTVTAAMHRVTADDAPVPIGRPVAGARCYVMDPLGRLVPPGVAGELWVAGAGVARGYRHIESTAFVDDPFTPGGRCYRTGDKARWNGDGRLEYLGRCDDQVKVRGYRVEPGEVEAALRADPLVDDAAVTVSGTGGDAHLVGYLVSDGADTTAVRDRLRTLLPEHMVPHRWVRMTALPTLASGKVDRRALPEPSDDDTGRSRVPPRGDAEEFVAEVWSNVLGVSGIWSDDHFFALGGHSLAATRVVGRLRDALRVPVRVQLLFDRPFLADFAAAVEALLLDDVSGRADEAGV